MGVALPADCAFRVPVGVWERGRDLTQSEAIVGLHPCPMWLGLGKNANVKTPWGVGVAVPSGRGKSSLASQQPSSPGRSGHAHQGLEFGKRARRKIVFSCALPRWKKNLPMSPKTPDQRGMTLIDCWCLEWVPRIATACRPGQVSGPEGPSTTTYRPARTLPAARE